jgi:hypothetical protein
MNEPDYEAIVEAHEYEREQGWLARMDARYGRVEDWLTSTAEVER